MAADEIWTCQLCTFENEQDEVICLMCDTPRPQAPGQMQVISRQSRDSFSIPPADPGGDNLMDRASFFIEGQCQSHGCFLPTKDGATHCSIQRPPQRSPKTPNTPKSKIQTP